MPVNYVRYITFKNNTRDCDAGHYLVRGDGRFLLARMMAVEAAEGLPGDAKISGDQEIGRAHV